MLPDMAAVVDFDSNAILVNNDHLSSDYELIKKNIDKIDSSGSTNLFDPIRIATDELIQYGDNSHIWVEILLTDGEDTTGHSHSQILGEAQRAANNGIVIYTIGLGRPTSIDEPLLIDIATITGGKYLRAQSANDLDAIYMEISKMVKKGDVAAYDDNIYDNIPLVDVLIPNYIHYVSGTAVPLPSYIGQYNGKMTLQWNVSEIKINQTWSGKFKVTSSLDGSDLQSILYPDTIASYIRHDGQRYIDSFPEALIDVLAVKGGKICGCKWYDRDKDGFIDSDEPKIEGFKIELLLNNTLEQSIYTDANGTYCFDDLDEGNYTVKEVMPDDPDNYFTWLQTYPGGNGTWEISVVGIFEKLNADFGNVVEFTGGRSWGYWKTHTGLDSPPRDEAYDNLIHYPFEIDVTTPNGDALVESDVEAKWVFDGTGSGEPPNCSGTCRSLFRVQLLALHLNVLKFGGMEFLTYVYPNDQYSGWTIREIIDEGIDKLLAGGLSYSFTNFQVTLDKINNNHHRSNGSYVLVMSDPPVVCYTLCKHQINSYTGPPKITKKTHYCTILDNVEISEISIENQESMRKIKQKDQRLSTYSTEHFPTIVKRPPVILLP